jgi:hypothetical protein
LSGNQQVWHIFPKQAVFRRSLDGFVYTKDPQVFEVGLQYINCFEILGVNGQLAY